MNDRVECAPRQSPIKARARARDGAINDKTILSVWWSLNRTLPWRAFSLLSSVVSLPATAISLDITHKGQTRVSTRPRRGERDPSVEYESLQLRAP